MNYYISESPLHLREYGRNVQGLVEHAIKVEDKAKRTQIAHEIIRIIITLNPKLKEQPDYLQKLWDALHIMSDFRLDVDAPFPAPQRAVIESRPSQRVPYNKEKSRYKQYGRSVEKMIAVALAMPEGPKRAAYVNILANTMKLFLRPNDREAHAEHTIAEHIRDLSDGRLQVRAEEISLSKMPPPLPQTTTKQRVGNNNNSNNKRSRSKRRRKSQ
ncbi:MAG: hypothetical protein OHK0039_07920 [Bacteroidia bacterium]